MACDKPVGLSPCASKGIFFHHCLRRLVLNRTHHREIPLRNARMRINLDASMKKSQVESLLFVCHSVSGEATITNIEPILCIFMAWEIPAKESFGMPQPAVALSITNMMKPTNISFFTRSPFVFFSSRVTCLVVLPIGPFMCLQVNYLSSLSPSTCVEQNKMHDREIALWNARTRIYFDANVCMVILFHPRSHLPYIILTRPFRAGKDMGLRWVE